MRLAGTDDDESDCTGINFGDRSEPPTVCSGGLPSHERPSGATAKPGVQAVQEKEPAVLVQTPVGHAPGVWHSSISEGRGTEGEGEGKKDEEKVNCGLSSAKGPLKSSRFDRSLSYLLEIINGRV